MRVLRLTAVAAVVLSWGGLALPTGSAKMQPPVDPPSPELFFLSASADDDEARDAMDQIARSWRDGYVGIFRDLMRLISPPPARPRVDGVGIAGPSRPRNPPDRGGFSEPELAFPDPGRDRAEFPEPDRESASTRVWRRLSRFVADQTGLRLRQRADDLSDIQQWLWAKPYDPHPDYAMFKGIWYSQVDPRFQEFFRPGASATIRLDEIDWGGVGVNGIPPLVNPRVVSVADELARYLDDGDIVFGIAAGGETRAYPKRILAWHEMALDTLGGIDLTIVYCTLCGTVIPYESVVNGEPITFGTSGLLYRSNKLMFDIQTNSLWNTFEGVPVVGPRVGSGLRLTRRAVVTTTWGEWRRQHPDASVLSLQTGYDRDYSEGAAYREYFSTDRLMFEVPLLDDRLRNKDEVVVMLVDDGAGARQPLAVSAEFLNDNRVYHLEYLGHHFVVVTSRKGANRVYDAGDIRFERQLGDDRLVDSGGGVWVVHEDAIVSERDPGRRRPREAAQRAFWFGWYSQFPNTVLIR